jgi:hypothetical protein
MASITKLTNNNPDSNVQYFIYDHGSNVKFGEFKKYVSQYGYSLIDSDTAYSQAITDLEGNADSIPADTLLLDGSNNFFIGTPAGGNLPAATSTVETSKENDVSAALVIQYNQDYYKLMERKYVLLKNNTLTSYNQEIALKYIFCFFLVISIYTFSTNIEKLNLTHVIIYIFFLIYIFYHKSLSNYLLSSFKSSFYELKVSTTATQIISYLKIMFFMLLTFLIPLVVFSSVSDQPFVPFMSATDNLTASDALESTKDMVENTVETVTEGAKDAVESTSKAVGDVTDSIVDNTKSATESISESLNDAVESAKDAVAPKPQTGGIRKMTGGKKK